MSRDVDEVVDSTLAVVRDRLPVKPDRETVARVLREHGGWFADLPADEMDCCADAVLDLFPGRSEAEATGKAEQYETYRHRIDVLNARLAALGFPRCACHPAEDDSERCLPDPAHWLAEVRAEAWAEGVAVALNHAIRNEDGITLRLEHFDSRNPYREGGAS